MGIAGDADAAGGKMQSKISPLIARYPEDGGLRKQNGNHTLERTEGNLIFPFFFLWNIVAGSLS